MRYLKCCSDVSFSVRKGEILGFTGLVGAGRTEIMQLIYGYTKKDAGRIFVNGKETIIHSPRDAVSKGIGLIPEERKKQGLVLGLSVFDNSALTVLDKYSFVGFLRQKDLTPGILLDFFQNLQILPHLLLIDHIAGSLQLINLHWLSRPLPVQDLRRLSMEVPICSVLPYMDPDQILPH